MFVEPSNFDSHVRFLKRHFQIVPLHSIMRKGAGNSLSRPLCALTFDDGWDDFYEYAYPVLKAHDVPATVFLATDFIGTGHWMWTDRLALLIQRRAESATSGDIERESTDPIVNALEKIGGHMRSRTETAIRMLKGQRLDKIEAVIAELGIRWNIEPKMTTRGFLTWAEIREMFSSGLITFGSHTAGHNILTTLFDAEVKRELLRSGEVLVSERIVVPGFIPFCYPNGSYDNKIVSMVGKAGYHLAVTTERGWNAYTSDDPYRLRRISIHQDICSTVAMLECRIAGFI
jgi:peptidoglycan/xylan/chitin deacetylase (PgdA/CDA1 family)